MAGGRTGDTSAYRTGGCRRPDCRSCPGIGAVRDLVRVISAADFATAIRWDLAEIAAAVAAIAVVGLSASGLARLTTPLLEARRSRFSHPPQPRFRNTRKN